MQDHDKQTRYALDVLGGENMDKLKQLIAVPSGRHFAVMEPIRITFLLDDGITESGFAPEDGFDLHPVLFFGISESGEPTPVYLEYDGKECFMYADGMNAMCELDAEMIGDCVIVDPYGEHSRAEGRHLPILCLNGEDADLIVKGSFRYEIRKWYDHEKKT